METKKRSLTAAPLCVLFLLCAAGCAVRNGPAMTPTQQISFTLNQTVAATAAINKSLAQDVITLNTSGLLKKPLTNSILGWQKAVAGQVIAAETIQRSGQSDAQKAIAIKAAFSQLPLPADVAELLNTTEADQAVVGVITAIQSIRTLIAALAGGVR